MPYSIPAPTPAPLPIHSQGRPGHRRSFSEIAYNGFGAPSTTSSARPPLHHQPQSHQHLRSHSSGASSSTAAPSTSTTTTNGAFAPLVALPTRRKPASFHLEADDDDDDSSPEDEAGSNTTRPAPTPAPTAARLAPHQHQHHHHRRISPTSSSTGLAALGLRPTPPGRPATPTLHDDDDENDELARGLPPLKLKIPNVGSAGSSNLPFSPTQANPNSLPFPTKGRGSPAPSPPRSRTSSFDTLLLAPPNRTASPLSAPPSSASFADQQRRPRTGSGSNTPTSSSSRPQVPRTASTPSLVVVPGTPASGHPQRSVSISQDLDASGRILLSNGKPLKSSLKSSASSPNIPFPSQSLVPSRIYAEIAAARERERLSSLDGQSHEHQAHHDGDGDEGRKHIVGYPDVPLSNRHARAASAPALPSLVLGASSSSSSSATSSPHGSTPGSPSATCPPTPSAPKAVHFPASDTEGGEKLATVKFFKRSARPASLSLPGASGGEETETETDGEGYNSGPGASANSSGSWGSGTGWGWGGYVNPWDRYTAAAGARAAQQQQAGASVQQQGQQGQAGRGPGGYPFPRIASAGGGSSGKAGSPLSGIPQRTTSQQLLAQHMAASQQGQPQQAKKASKVAGGEGEKKTVVYELDEEVTSLVPRRELGLFDNVFLETLEVSCSSTTATTTTTSEDQDKPQQVTLSGTLLVRNLAYEKHVSVRFTLDEWHTTSEVKAGYKESLERLPGRWVKAMGSRERPEITAEEKEKDLQAAKQAPVNPQWDRFAFSIDLSDYARSRSLVNRRMWLVARFAVPGIVRVPVPVPLMSSSYTAIASSSSNANSNSTLDASVSSGSPSGEKLHLLLPDVLGPSDGEMLNALVNGLSGAYPSATPEERDAGRKTVEELLRRRSVCVGGGVGSEWWDNNGGGNFRVGFKEGVHVVPVSGEGSGESGDDEQQERMEREEREKMESAVEMEKSRRRRMNAVSCPPMFNGTAAPPPPMSILGTSLSHSTLSPPQVSVSTSLDSTLSPPTSSTTSATANVPSANYGGGPTTNSGSPKPWPTRTPAANKAMAETTLERLKRLNLRNYAAPAPVVVIPPSLVGGRQAAYPTSSSSSVASKAHSNNANGDATLRAEGPPSRTSSTSSTSSLSSGSSGSAYSSGSDLTPMTSPLVTPTLGSVDVRWSLGSLYDDDGGSVDGEDGSQKDSLKGGEGGDEGGVVHPEGDGEGMGTPRPRFGGGVVIGTEQGGSPNHGQNGGASASEVLSPLLFGSFMAGPGGAFNFAGEPTGGVDVGDVGVMGTSPPFSSLLGGGGLGFSWGVSSPSASTGASVNGGAGGGVSTNGGGASIITLPTSPPPPASNESSPSGSGDDKPGVSKPAANLLLENIREKSTSVDGPGGGRRSPVPQVGSGRSSPSGLGVPGSAAASVVQGKRVPSPTTGLGSGSDSSSSVGTVNGNGSGGSGGSGSGGKGTRRHGHHHHARGQHQQQGLGLVFGAKAPVSPQNSPVTSSGSSSSLSSLRSKNGPGAIALGAPGRTAPPPPPPVPVTSPTSPSGPVMGRSSLDDIRDPDSIYQAFVRQWCFASGPAPAQAGGFGSMEKAKDAPHAGRE